MNLDSLRESIFTLATETDRYHALFGSEGTPNGFVELNTVLSINDEESLANAILELARLNVVDIKSSYADIENWLKEIQIVDDRLYWKFPIYT